MDEQLRFGYCRNLHWYDQFTTAFQDFKVLANVRYDRIGQLMSSRTIDFRYAPRDGWTLICGPDDAHKSLVREDGALLYGFDGRVVDVCQFHTVLELSAGTALRPLAVEQRTESARRPIVRTVLRYPNQTLELVAFAHDEGGRRTDVVLWTITAAEETGEVLACLHVEGHLRGRMLAAAPGDSAPHELYAVADDAPLTLPPEGTDGIPRMTTATADDACVLRSAPQPLIETYADGFRPVSAVMTTPTLLRAGESVCGAILVPLNHAETAALDHAWAERALAAERRRWDALELMPNAIEVPDAELQDLLLACSRNILQAREREDGLPILHVGPTIYRGLWLVDGHFLLEAARYLGFDEAAEAGLDVLLRRVKPDGSIAELESLPHIKETGIAIATLVRQCELSGALERLRRDWPVVRAAVMHIEGLRRRARALPAEHPLHGLLPDAFGDGGLAGCRPEYTTVAWTLIGLRHAAHGARLLGEADDAERFGAAYEALRRDFERVAAAQRQALPDGDGHYLPMCPPESGSHQFVVGAAPQEVPRWRAIQPETATWALCHAIWPGEVLAPEHRLVRDLLELFERRDDEQGIPATTGWLPYRSVWSYAASFAAHVWLYAGRPDKAVDYLYAFANHAFPTRVWREEQSLHAAANRHVCGDMPHNWASAELIRLVRHLLVFERGDGIELLAGVPEEWLRPGCAIRVERTPTRFGLLTLHVDADDAGCVVRVTRHRSNHPAPDGIVLRVPHGWRGEVRVDGAPAAMAAADWVALMPAADVPVVVELRR